MVRRRANAAMRRLLREVVVEAKLDAPLGALLKGGFVEREGCVLLAAQAGSVKRLDERLDRIGIEALVNHLHVEDRLAARDREEVVEQAYAYASELAQRLDQSFPASSFEVVLSISDSCVVRFYRRRPAEAWLMEDLESYADEALLVLTVE
jgi:hypothetical protein